MTTKPPVYNVKKIYKTAHYKREKNMANKKMFSRRNFVKGGLAAAGISVFGKASVYGADDPAGGLEAPGPIPLNNILTDYFQTRAKFDTRFNA